MIRVPLIEVRDKTSGEKHIVGTDIHDSLTLRDGSIEYYNLQNGCGTGPGGEYEFVYNEEIERMIGEENIDFCPLDKFISIMIHYYEEKLSNYRKSLDEYIMAIIEMMEKCEKEEGSNNFQNK